MATIRRNEYPRQRVSEKSDGHHIQRLHALNLPVRDLSSSQTSTELFSSI